MRTAATGPALEQGVEKIEERKELEKYRKASAALALTNFRNDSAAAWKKRFGEHTAREQEKELR